LATLAELGLGDQNGAQCFRRNEERLHVGDGASVDEGGASRELPHLG
jgi:hypothetical protein